MLLAAVRKWDMDVKFSCYPTYEKQKYNLDDSLLFYNLINCHCVIFTKGYLYLPNLSHFI